MLRDNYFRSGEGFMFVYAIDMASSLNSLQDIYQSILRVLETDNVRLFYPPDDGCARYW
jgi:hypothetical protein